MERKEFLLKSCGLCGCAALTIFTGQSVKAAVADEPEDWRIGFMQKRFSHLVGYMNDHVDEKTRTSAIEEMGRFCARQHSDNYLKYKGKTEEFLKNLEGQFIEKTAYDKENNTIRLLGNKHDNCVCAFAGNNSISAEFCSCSRGYMKEMLSAVIGKPVEVTLDESVLRGSDRCSFTARIL